MQLAIVVAVADNGVIGRNGQLPWHLPDDLKHFKALTLGKPIVMGRRTFESIGRALPGRRNLVVSSGARQQPLTTTHNPVEWVGSLAEAEERCSGVSELCVIGGAALYADALPRAQLIHLTRVHARPEGDVYFPPLASSQWREIAREAHAADAHHTHAMSFLTLQRIAVAGLAP
jgi:dihydrofolate reductase